MGKQRMDNLVTVIEAELLALPDELHLAVTILAFADLLHRHGAEPQDVPVVMRDAIAAIVIAAVDKNSTQRT